MRQSKRAGWVFWVFWQRIRSVVESAVYYLTLVISVVYSRRRPFSGAIEYLPQKVDAGSHVLTPGPVPFPIVSCKNFFWVFQLMLVLSKNAYINAAGDLICHFSFLALLLKECDYVIFLLFLLIPDLVIWLTFLNEIVKTIKGQTKYRRVEPQIASA